MSNDARSSYIQRLQQTMNDSGALEKYVDENVLVVQFFYQEMKEEKVKQVCSFFFS